MASEGGGGGGGVLVLPSGHASEPAVPGGHRVRSLIWAGDRLVDPVGGGASVGLDGSVTRRSVNWAYPFDRALASDDGQTTVLYTALGTKGLVIRGQRVVREINRSFYHADDYEFPVTVGRLNRRR